VCAFLQETSDGSHQDQIIEFPVSRTVDFEGGCAALFDRGMVPVTRLLDTLGAFVRHDLLL
jgi:hypothetical protein